MSQQSDENYLTTAEVARKLKVKPGQKLRLIQDLYTMQWLVKGVVGSPKG